MKLLTIPSFDMRQKVIPVAEAPTMPCPKMSPYGHSCSCTAHEECAICDDSDEWACPYGCTDGRVPFTAESGGRIAIAVPAPSETMAERLALNIHLYGTSQAQRNLTSSERTFVDEAIARFEAMDGLGYLIVASAHVDAVVPVEDTDHRFLPYEVDSLLICPSGLFRKQRNSADADYDITDQLAYATFTPGDHALMLSDVQPTTDRCPACWDELIGTMVDVAKSISTGTTKTCPACVVLGKCPPIPVAAGEAWREWPT